MLVVRHQKADQGKRHCKRSINAQPISGQVRHAKASLETLVAQERKEEQGQASQSQRDSELACLQPKAAFTDGRRGIDWSNLAKRATSGCHARDITRW